MIWVVEATSFPRRRLFVGFLSVWALSVFCTKNAVMFVFGPPFCVVCGFPSSCPSWVFSIRCFRSVSQKKRGGVFTAVSGAHVTHIHAVRLQALSRIVPGHIARHAHHCRSSVGHTPHDLLSYRTAGTAFLEKIFTGFWGCVRMLCGFAFSGWGGVCLIE